MSDRSSSPYVPSSPNFRREEDQNNDELDHIDELLPIPNHVNVGDAVFFAIPVFGAQIHDRPEDLDSNASSQYISSSPIYGTPARNEDSEEYDLLDENDGLSLERLYQPKHTRLHYGSRDDFPANHHDEWTNQRRAAVPSSSTSDSFIVLRCS